MNIEHIRSFLEIAETGNFNRAAERLNVTQSTVSARIKSLELVLDRALFSRGPAGAELTAAGRQFRRYALSIVQTWQQAGQEIGLPEGYRAVFGLGTQVSLWDRLVLQWMAWMRDQAPDVALDVQADYSDSQMRQLSDGLLDAGVMYSPRATPGLVIEKLLEERLIMVGTEPRGVEDGWLPDYVLIDWGPEFRAQHSLAFPDMETPAITVGLGAMGLSYILANGGAGYQPLRVVRPHLADGRLHRIDGAPSFGRPAYLVHPAEPPDAEVAALALAGLRQVAASESED